MHFTQQLVVRVMLLAVVAPISIQAVAVCPTEANYSPCACSSYFGDTLLLDCYNKNLDDARTGRILSAFLQDGISPLGAVRLWANQLTRVPDQIKLFAQLSYADFLNNPITSIQANSFNFIVRLENLNLGYNRISSIEPGAFQGDGYGNGSIINLDTNSLTRFDSAIFQSVLEKMAPFGGFPTAYVNINNNPIDCVKDSCHLAWLIRDSRQLLSSVRNGQCSNGTAFDKLNPNGYVDCPTFFCPDSADGQYPDPLACDSYYLCVTGVAYPYTCPGDLVFNPAIGRCDSQSNVPSCVIDKPFVCPNPSGQYPDPKSCYNYYTCVDSVPYLQSCPGGLAFNPSIGQCDNPANVPSCRSR